MAHSVAPMHDRQIVAAMRGHPTAGLANAYDTYAERLHAYAVSILSDHDAAADAVHDTFLIAGQRIADLRNPAGHLALPRAQRQPHRRTTTPGQQEIPRRPGYSHTLTSYCRFHRPSDRRPKEANDDKGDL